MVKRIGSSRRKTRHKFKKSVRQRGKISISRFFQKLEVNDRVALVAEPSYHKGLYFRRFHGKIGKVVGKRGFCYIVEIKDGGKKKEIIVHPVHLKKVGA